jgi:hypothetical protein
MRLALFDKGRLGIVDGDTITDVTDQIAALSAHCSSTSRRRPTAPGPCSTRPADTGCRWPR